MEGTNPRPEGLKLGLKRGFTKPGLPDVQKQVEETSICWSHQRGPQALIQFMEAWIWGGGERIKGSPAAKVGETDQMHSAGSPGRLGWAFWDEGLASPS